jgi:PKD repeat protein
MKIRLRRLVAGSASVAMVAAGLTLLVAAPASASQLNDPGPADTLPTSVPSAITPAVNDGRVFGIAENGTNMIIGGSFTQVGGQSHTSVAVFNKTTGALSSSFAPTVNGDVNAVLPGPTTNTVYIGGAFTTVNGAAAQFVAELNTTTGALVPGFTPAKFNFGYINDMVARGNRLYVAGTFTTVGGKPHAGIASLNATTGALDPFMNVQFTGHHNDSGSGAQGWVGPWDIDATADGTKMIVIGNFKYADGLLRDQIAMIDLSGASAQVANWATSGYSPYCFNWAFDSYVRGVSFSPDGSYFVVNATGGGNANTLCDATSRFETNMNDSNAQPTWVDETGGDTVWGIAVTNTAVYIGGHNRWNNNPLGVDQGQPGSVPRPGLAALDPLNGRPFAWNPGRKPLGVAVFAVYAGPSGVWIGSNTDWVGNFQYKRPKLAFFPYAGGYTPADTSTSALPGTVYLAGAKSAKPTGVLYRVNAGGPTVPAIDGGPDWVSDNSDPSPYRNTGSNPAGYGPGAGEDNTVPATTPGTIFNSERWSPSDNPAMQWAFPVASGTPIEVRLYFANRCTCTSSPGQRVFNVALDGTTVLNNFDIAAAAGDQTGTMRKFDITSDGSVNIDFSHVVENPLVDGIEIVQTNVTPPPPNNVLYRVNAGGPQIQSLDGGPNWAEDDSDPSDVRNNGSNAAGWGPGETIDNTVPSTTPMAVFESERWSPSDNPPMSWAFPVTKGAPIEVRLYFANRCSCTSSAGQRVFNVAIDGTTVLNHYDIVADVGDQRGTMKKFDMTSDGNVNIDFSHVTENPLLNGIEIVRTDIPTPPSQADNLSTVAFNGTTATASTADNQGIDFGNWRGAFQVGDQVFYGRVDGYLYSRTLDSNGHFGPAAKIDPYNDPFWSDIDTDDGTTFRGKVPSLYSQFPNVTGMFYNGSRVYYTLFGDSHLYSRWFTPDAGIMDERSATSASSVDFSTADGMFVSGGTLYYGSRADNDLRSVSFSNGTVSGSPTVVSGPSIDGVNWSNKAMFLGPTGNAAPTASFTSNCTDLSCSFTGSGHDSDGTITGYSWDFGDSQTSTSASPSHTYTNPGTYTVTLTVTDNDNATGSVSHDVVVTAANAKPTARFTSNCTALACSFDGSGSTDDGSITSYAWDYGDSHSDTGVTPSPHTYANAGTYTVSLTVTDNGNLTDTVTHQVSVGSAGIAFVAAANAGGGNVKSKSVTVPGGANGAHAGDTALLFLTRTTPATWTGPTGVTGWTSVGSFANGSVTTQVWSKTLVAGDPGSAVQFSSATASHASVDIAVYSGVDAANPIVGTPQTGSDTAASSHTAPAISANAGDWVVSFWGDRSTAQRTWTLPSSVASRDASPDTATGGLTVQAAIGDSGGAVSSGAYPAQTATTDANTDRAAMWTIELNAA